MDPTLFASFRDANAAERAFNALLDLGIQPEDLSLLVNEFAEGGPPPGPEIEDVEGSRDDRATYDPSITGLADSNFGELRVEDEVSDRFEARVGGGISTSTPDDAAESIDQMDDGQSAAEEMIYPSEGKSFGSEERHDVTEAAVTGFFNTTEPETETLNGDLQEPGATVSVSSLRVHGLGRVLGDGALATLATGAAVAASTAGRPAAQVQDYLLDAGVAEADAEDLYAPFSRGGAILAATVRPGDAEGLAVEETLMRFGPEDVRTYNDIPEPNG